MDGATIIMKKLFLSVSVASLTCALALLESTPASAQAAAPEGTTVQEVIVTASKRNEKLQNAPEAISVLGATTLVRQHIQQFADYASLVPNLAQAGGAGEGSGTVILRGLYTGSLSTTNTTAIYLGDTPFSPSGAYAAGAYSTPDPDLVDVDHIEVLKGPQGTLYGANSLGGLIRIIPKEPSLSGHGLSGSVQVGGSDDGAGAGYNARASVYDTVIPGTLAVGASAFDRQDPGFITNVTTGSTDIGQTNASGGAVSVVFSPAENLTLHGRALYQDANQIGLDYQSNQTGTGTPLYGDWKQAAFFNQSLDTRYSLFELSADYKTALGTLTVIGSDTDSRLSEQEDYSAFELLLPKGDLVEQPLVPDTHSDNFEARFVSRRIGRFEFILGGFYTDQSNKLFTSLNGLAANQTPLPAPLYHLLTAQTDTSYREAAVYGDVTFYLTDDLDLTAGLRQTGNTQSGTEVTSGLLTSGVIPLDSHDGRTLYQANLRWRPTSNLSLYARTASGYRPGGAESNPFAPERSYQPDTVYDYEVGAKGSYFQHRLTFDGSLYYINWENIQLNSTYEGITYTGNAGAAHIKGLELQTAIVPFPGLTLGGAFGYNDAIITSVGASTIGAVPGDRLPGSPKVTLSVVGDYAFDLGVDLKGDVGATLRYQGDKVASYSDDLLNPQYDMPAYTTIDLRASVTRKEYTFRVGVSNLTNADGYTGYNTTNIVADQGVPSYAYVTRPRTVYMSVSANF